MTGERGARMAGMVQGSEGKKAANKAKEGASKKGKQKVAKGSPVSGSDDDMDDDAEGEIMVMSSDRWVPTALPHTPPPGPSLTPPGGGPPRPSSLLPLVQLTSCCYCRRTATVALAAHACAAGGISSR